LFKNGKKKSKSKTKVVKIKSAQKAKVVEQNQEDKISQLLSKVKESIPKPIERVKVRQERVKSSNPFRKNAKKISPEPSEEESDGEDVQEVYAKPEIIDGDTSPVQFSVTLGGAKKRVSQVYYEK
jgi:hypothetical protein